jgi:quercetin 2,3-dioxygenase
MKKILFPANQRGFADHGWLKANHSFSFANYYDPKKVNFGAIRVLNDDIIAGGMGFGRHPHDNMEIVTIPLSGALKHEDSEGNSAVIYAGDVQHMSAGTGIYHSEKNASETEEVRLFQIWLFPKLNNIKPVYHQQTYNVADRLNKFQVVVSPDAADNAVTINQEALFYLGNFEENQEINFTKRFPNNGIYLMVIEGEIEVFDEKLGRRDAIGLSEINTLQIKTTLANTQLLLLEVPM